MKTNRITVIGLIRKTFPSLSSDEILIKLASGEIYADGVKISSKETLVSRDCCLEIKDSSRFVSRGGDKLDYILNKWDILVKDKVFLDAGVSTGGFTDCLLKRGASKVYSVDVGFNQVDYSLRKDARVTLFENTNIRHITREQLNPLPDCAVCDLSFRSIKGIAPHILSLIKDRSYISLVKPQFEYHSPEPGFDGVIKETSLLYHILTDLIEGLIKESVFVSRVEFSPIKGRKGNREFFFLLHDTKQVEKDVLFGGIKGMLELP